jgi:hypothetical protein
VTAGTAWKRSPARSATALSTSVNGAGSAGRLREWRTRELTLCDACDRRFPDPPYPVYGPLGHSADECFIAAGNWLELGTGAPVRSGK